MLQGIEDIGHPGGKAGGIDGACQGKSAAKEQEYAPGKLARVLPLHDAAMMLEVHWHYEKQDAEGDGNECVVHKGQDRADERLQYPARGSTAEEQRGEHLGVADGPELCQLFFNMLMHVGLLEVEAPSCQPPPGDDGENDDQGNAQNHPLSKAYDNTVPLGQKGPEERVWGGPNQCAHAAYA